MRLLAKKGQSDEARAMLSDIYNWFIEGFDTADLKDAKALFDRDLLHHEEELVNRRIEQIVQSNVTPIYYR